MDEETGLYYYGARYYNPRLSQWLSVDPLAEKYPNISSYAYVDNNPVIYIDPDGREKIVVVGNQGNSPNSDKDSSKKSGYKFGEGTRHFLQAGLDQARMYKKQSGNEMVTMIIYEGSYSSKELDVYKNAAAKDGINVRVISDDADVIDYINKKAEFSFFGSTSQRDEDLISDFSYFGHGVPDGMLIGGGSTFFSDEIDASDLNASAFSEKANIYLNSCGSALGSLFEGMKSKTQGKVKGYNTTVYWGRNGIGKYEPFGYEYKFPWEDRSLKGRKKITLEQGSTTQNGTR